VTDLGSKGYTIIDKDGEDRADVMIKNIQSNGTVTALLDTNHGFETGDMICFSEIIGLSSKDKPDLSTNGKTFKVLDVISSSEFVIDADFTTFNPYVRDGVAKYVKTPIKKQAKPLSEIFSQAGQALDSNLSIHDFSKLEQI
jgi:hypothetical protein